MNKQAQRPVFFIFYNHNDITREVKHYVESVICKESAHGKSDSLKLILNNKYHYWEADWKPQKGDTIEVYLGYYGDKNMYHNIYEIDEISIKSPPDTFIIKGMGTAIKKSLRQLNTKAWRFTTLLQILEEMAEKHRLDLVSDVYEDISFDYKLQSNETDLSFLNTLANTYGYYFKVTDKELVFLSGETKEQDKLYIDNEYYMIERGRNVKGFNFKTKTFKLYKGCEVKYYDGLKDILTEKVIYDENIVKGDILRLNKKADNEAEAERMARAILKKYNKKEITGEISIYGDQNLVSGYTVGVKGFGDFEGNYFIDELTHMIDTSGFTTVLKLHYVEVLQ